jgi:DNA-binding transcriptional LysR family regulator
VPHGGGAIADRPLIAYPARNMTDTHTPALDWDDLRHLIAVAEGGNLVEGAKLLGVNHTTVLRRLAALESRLGGPLFARKGRYVPTRLGESALAAAKAMSAHVERLDFSLAQGLQPLSGPVELVVQHAFLARLTWPFLAEFLDAHPAVALTVVTTADPPPSRHIDAMIGIGEPPAFGQSQTLREVRWRAYANPAVAARLKSQASDAAAGIPFVEVTAVPRECAKWLVKQAGPAVRQRLTVATLDDARIAAVQGVGIALLPSVLGHADDGDLIPLSDTIDRLTGQAWICLQARAVGVPRVEAIVEFLASRLAADSAWAVA